MNRSVVEQARAILSQGSPYDFEDSPIALAHVVSSGRIVRVNSAWASVVPPGDAIWKLLELPQNVAPIGATNFGALLATVVETGREVLLSSSKHGEAGDWWCHLADANVLRRALGVDMSPVRARRRAFRAIRGMAAQMA